MDRLMVKGLHHEWGMNQIKFFSLVDELGGWPVGYKYAGFEHTDERQAGFTNSGRNDGWWTVVADSDDYYLWKLSPAAKKKFAKSVIKSARITLSVDTLDYMGGVGRYTKISLKG